MRILVTGAAGFMGSHLVEYLINEGHLVSTMDNMSTGFKSNLTLKAFNNEVDLVTEKARLEQIIADFKPEVVFHLAAWAHEGLSQFSPIKVTENNLNATLNILIPSIKHGAKKFVFTSSMSVYGEGNPPFNENDIRNPVDIYGVAKTAGERVLEVLAGVHDFDYTIVRPHNVYGPRQSLSDPYRNVVGIFLRRAMEGKPLMVYGDGEQTRAFTYIDDITSIIAKLKDSTGNGQIYNIGPREEYSINHLAELVSKIFDVDVEHLPDRPLEVKHAFCTNDKAIAELGYRTNTSFEDGILKTAAWAKVLKKTNGVAKPKYLDELELVTESTPRVWLAKSL